jgi:hypothetical protein
MLSRTRGHYSTRNGIILLAVVFGERLETRLIRRASNVIDEKKRGTMRTNALVRYRKTKQGLKAKIRGKQQG